MTSQARARVLVVDPVHHTLLPALAERYEVREHLGPDPATLRVLLAETDAIVLRSGVRLTEAEFDAAKQLRFVARAGVGTDNIDLACARARGIAVFNVPDLSAVSVAELSFALALAVARNVALADRQLRAGLWRKKDLVGSEFAGKTIGIVGLGQIGRQVARIAQGFGMHIVASVRHHDAERVRACTTEGIALMATDQLLTQADIVTLHCPLTPQTRGLIDGRALASMRPGAYLVNMARGGVVDEQALYAALAAGTIAGAATDVFAREGTATPLTTLDNFVATPHIGAMTDEAQRRIAQTLLADLVRAFAGEPIHNRVV